MAKRLVLTLAATAVLGSSVALPAMTAAADDDVTTDRRSSRVVTRGDRIFTRPAPAPTTEPGSTASPEPAPVISEPLRRAGSSARRVRPAPVVPVEPAPVAPASPEPTASPDPIEADLTSSPARKVEIPTLRPLPDRCSQLRELLSSRACRQGVRADQVKGAWQVESRVPQLPHGVTVRVQFASLEQFHVHAVCTERICTLDLRRSIEREIGRALDDEKKLRMAGGKLIAGQGADIVVLTRVSDAPKPRTPRLKPVFPHPSLPARPTAAPTPATTTVPTPSRVPRPLLADDPQATLPVPTRPSAPRPSATGRPVAPQPEVPLDLGRPGNHTAPAGTYTLVATPGTSRIPAGARLTVTLGARGVGFSTGCNSFDADSLAGPFSSTKMGCFGTEVDAERWASAFFAKGPRPTLRATTLVLTAGDETVTLEHTGRQPR